MGLFVLGASILIQLAAAVIAGMIAWTTIRRSWMLIAFAILLMSVRRGVSFYQAILVHRVIDPVAESVALLISILMLGGLLGIFLRGGASVFPSRDPAAGTASEKRRKVTDPGAIAALLGVLTILAASVVVYYSYTTSRNALIASIFSFNLSRVQSLSALADSANLSLSPSERVELVHDLWDETPSRYDGSYLCIVDSNSILSIHTGDPSLVGQYVGDTLIRDEARRFSNISELLEAKTSWAGRYVSVNGENQIAAFSYSSTLSSLVSVHVPAKAVEREILLGTLPLGASLVFILAILLPAALGVLYRAYSATLRTVEASDARYRAVVEDQTELICRFVLDGTILFVNEAYCRYFGMNRKELVGQKFMPMIPEEDQSKVQEHFTSLGPQNPVATHEHRVILPDGEIRWQSWTNRAILDKEGDVVEYQGTGRDITELRRAEEALRESEARNRATLEAMPDLTFRLSREGVYLDFHASSQEQLFVAPEDIVGKSVDDLLPKTVARKYMESIERTFDTKTIQVFEYELKFPGGDKRSYEARLAPCEEHSVLAVVRNITEREQAEAQLRLIQFSIDHDSNAIYRVKFDGSICYANQAASQSLGYTQDELLAMTVPEIDPDFPVKAWPAHWRDMKEVGSMTFEARHKTKDGWVFPVEVQSNLLSYDGEEYIWAYVRDLSEKKTTEKNLRASEERFRKAFNYSPIGMAIVSPSGAFLDVNDVLCETIGYSAEELLARDFHSITHPDDLDASAEMREKLLSGAVSRVHTEKRYVHKDGRTIWARLGVATVSDEEGTPQILLAQIEDVSARVLAGQRLDAAEDRSREVLETAADAIITIDRKGAIELFNPAASEMFGYGPDEVIGQNIRMLMPEPDRTKHDSYLLRYLDTREKRIIGMKREVIARKKDGRLFPVELSISEAWTGDQPTFTGIVRDITERKLAEDQMREHAALVEIAPSAILLLNLDDTVKFCNRATEEIYGWPQKEILGQRWDRLSFAPESHEYADLKEIILAEGIWHGELKQIHQSGRELALDAHTVLLRDERDRPRSILLVCNDITQKKALELQHLHSQRLESLGTLAAGISHDLNSILTPILMAINPLRDSIKEEHAREILDTVQNCAERGTKIVKQVLTFGRESEGKPVRLEPGAALLETKSIISDTFPKSIRLRWEIDEDVSSIFADPTHLQQVLLNLCLNARDAMPEGGDLHVHVENVAIDEKMAGAHLDAQPGLYVAFHVRDSGTGIPPDVLDRIFDPFFTTKGPGAGTGLGLATVSTIVKSLKGFIDVQTEIGKGTDFKIYIPASDTSVGGTIKDVEVTARCGAGKLILVVDDEIGITTLSRRILESNGYKVLTAGDGVEAKALFEKHQDEIDLLLTDVMMPRMGGASLIRAIHVLNADLKVVAISGLSDQISANLEIEADEVIMKPFDADTLLSVVGRVFTQA